MGIDYFFYGTWTLVAYNFIQFNVIGGLGSFFGIHSWHWYLSQGLPTMLFTFAPLFIAGCIIARRSQRTLLWVLLWDIAVHSLIAHKEFRYSSTHFMYFISPILYYTKDSFFRFSLLHIFMLEASYLSSPPNNSGPFLLHQPEKKQQRTNKHNAKPNGQRNRN